MPDRNRFAFTLVELLVVIVIISMLMALLLPAVIGARERARQTQCSNNQKQLAVASHQYESDKDHIPGYITNFGASINTSRLSWLVVLLPYLGREDLWTEWRDPTRSYNYKRSNAMVDLGQLRCPSDSRSGPGVLSYVANCGIQAGTGTPDPGGSGTLIPENQTHGIFQNRSDATPAPLTTDRIPDGSQTTLLFSENLQATLWAPPLIDNDNTKTWTGLVDPAAGPDYREAHVGMVWTPSAPGPCQRINQCKDAEVELYDSSSGLPLNPPVLKPPYDAAPLGPVSFIGVARPSSFHVGGVVATYADSHQDFVDEDIDYNVFRQLMATHDQPLGL